MIGFCSLVVAGGLAFSQVESSCQVLELSNTAVQAEDKFGVSVAIHGDVAVIGADRFPSNGRGYARVYRRDGVQWVYEQTLEQPILLNHQYFARHLDVHSGTILVGCGNCNLGSVYAFQHEGGSWLIVQEIGSPHPGNSFGFGVAMDGGVAILGAPGDDDGGTDAGAAYIFRRTGTVWELEQKLLPLDPVPGNWFGYEVDISGDVAVVGPAFDSEAGYLAGAAYVFRRNGASWVQEQKLFSPNAQPEQYLGRELAVDADRIVLGVFAETGGGKVYVFRHNGLDWNIEQALLHSDPHAGDGFGSAVDICDDVIVAGAGGDDSTNPADMFCNSGAAYVFKNTGATWIQFGKLLADDGLCGDSLGTYDYRTIALDAAWALVGVPATDDACPAAPFCNSGSAYIFAIDGDCNGNDIVDTCEIQSGSVEDTNDDLIPDECPAISPLAAAATLGAFLTAGSVIASRRRRNTPSAPQLNA